MHLIQTCQFAQVQPIYFPPDLQRAVALCRYAIYTAFGSIIVLHTIRAGEFSINWLTICIAQSIIVQWVLQRTVHRIVMQAIYLTEWLWVVAVALGVGLPSAAAASFLLVVLVCHTTLWGGRWCLFVLSCGLTCAALFGSYVGFRIVEDIWITAVSLAAGVIFMLAICSIAHHQVRQQLNHGLWLKQQNTLLLRYLPKELPVHLETMSSLPFQRQWVTVLFVDVVGFTRSMQALPLEELSALLNKLFDDVHAAAEQWGGSVTKFLGDGALCVFPCLPDQRRGNVARQALRCAQLLPAQFSVGAEAGVENPYDVTLSLGLASGDCALGQWGVARRDFTVIGAPVNLANRLQRCASNHGGLLLDTTTARLAGEDRYLSPPLKLNLPGFGEREAYRAPLFEFDK
ncbi:MAG: adenylate/guanylate cyclase domain-containing protein [bacterium]